MDEYTDLFDENNLGKITDIEVQLHIDEKAKPIFKKARPVPYAIRKNYEESLDKLERQGIIEKVEFSEWASPVVPVKKPSGEIRLCGDYSGTINKHIISDVYPLPTLEDIVNKIGYGEHFTKLDLSQAFHQFPLEENSKKYTIINTLKGLYQYTRLVFGVPSATAICQRYLETLFERQSGVVVRVDDVLITGQNKKEHIQNVREVFEKLRQKNIKLKRNKVKFMLKEVEYNGFTISQNKVQPTPQKVEAIHSAEAPNNVGELRAFIGLANYLRNFVPKFAEVMAPLYLLLKKEVKWRWGKIENEAFNAIKDAITTENALKRYDPNGDLILQTDASGVGIGATILQTNEEGFLQPVAYASRILSKAEQNYSQIERELLGIVFGVIKYKLYILGRKFLLQTDHDPLTKICNEYETTPQLVSNRIKKWCLLLKAYDYKISHIPGKKNVIADFLSRKAINTMISSEEKSEEGEIMFIEDNRTTVKADCIASETKKDKILKQILEYTKEGWCNEPPENLIPYYIRRYEITIEQDILLWGERVIIPESLREILLKDLHAEHMGIVRTKQFARLYLWWPKLDSEIEEMVKMCEACQINSKNPKSNNPGTWSWPAGPWKRLHLDFAGPDEGGHMYLVIVDAYSKFLDIFVMNKADASNTIERLRRVFSIFGLPEHIVSDNGSQFTSEEFKEFLDKNDIQHTKTPTNHPATNGLAERYVGFMKETFKKIGKTNESLQSKIDRFLLTYRATPTKLGKSPAELLTNRQPRTRFNALRFTKTKQQVKVFQDNMNFKPSFEVEDTVFAKSFGRGAKWVPGIIIEIISPKSYMVQIKDVIWKRHEDQLKHRKIPEIENKEKVVERELKGSGMENVRSEGSVEENEMLRKRISLRGLVSKSEIKMGEEKVISKESQITEIRKTPQETDRVSNQDKNSERTSSRIKRETKRFITEI